jgi:hypothetical protein
MYHYLLITVVRRNLLCKDTFQYIYFLKWTSDDPQKFKIQIEGVKNILRADNLQKKTFIKKISH